MWSLLVRIKNRIVRLFLSSNNVKNKNQKDFFTENNYSIIEDCKTHFLIFNDGITIKLRKESSTDFEVFKQILIQKEYFSVLTFFQSNDLELKNVIDAGANIGLTSLYIKSQFPDALIAAIEPDENNFKLLKENLRPFIDDQSIQLFKAGLMGVSNLNLSISENFRGGGDWAKQTILTHENSLLKSVTIKDICEKQSFNYIDLLKIDIEGAETFLLQPETDLSFLSYTKVIAIEIHDEFNCRIPLQNLLKMNQFHLIEVGETTICINFKLVV